MSQPNLPANDTQTAIARVREELARRRISRQRLADEAKISVSTLEKVLSGRRPFTLATLVRLEDSLGISLRGKKSPAINGRDRSSVAPDELGNYARPSVTWLEGSYLTLIPSFGERAAISAYRTEIGWDDAQSCLSFRESDRVDSAFTQFGCVSMPNQTGHIYLVTNRHGQQRLAILARPTNGGAMHGILSTLYAGRGAQLTPVAVPIVLTPLGGKPVASFGRITTGHTDYARYRTILKRTLDDGFAVLMGL
jgi:transcriptional regulator with XRE-family HTH domain